MRRLILPLLSALALVAPACGGDDEGPVDNPGRPVVTDGGESSQSSAGGGAPAQGVQEVVMRDFSFEPAETKVLIGQTVVFRNEDSAPHNAVQQNGDALKTRDLQQGEKAEFRPDQEGAIEYICTIHPRMKGTLTVEKG